jgi:hypothetical protein
VSRVWPSATKKLYSFSFPCDTMKETAVGGPGEW